MGKNKIASEAWIAVDTLAGATTDYAVTQVCEAMGADEMTTFLLGLGAGLLVGTATEQLRGAVVDGVTEKCYQQSFERMRSETGEYTSFADLMPPDEAEAYLRFLENGSGEGLTDIELNGIGKVDEYLAARDIDYDAILKLRNGNEGGRYSAFKMRDSDKIVHNLTKDDIINMLDNGTIKSMKIANGLRNGDIKLNVLGDELF